jgi:polyisoprenyl-teichoic acid--peptidoglycan teichoic acid transferase
MTDLKQSSDGGARNPTGPSEPRPTEAASPITPLQATAAKPAPIRPAQPRAAQSAPIKPAQPRPAKTPLIKPAQPRSAPGSPIEPAQPRSAPGSPIEPAQPRSAPGSPIEPAQPRPGTNSASKPRPAINKPIVPVKAAQPSASQLADAVKAALAADAEADATAKRNATKTDAVAATSDVGPGDLQATTATKPENARASAGPNPTNARTAAPTKPVPAATDAKTASPRKPGSAKAHPGPPETVQTGFAQTQPQTKLGPAATAAFSAQTTPAPIATAIFAAPSVVREAAAPAAPTKRESTASAPPAAPTETVQATAPAAAPPEVSPPNSYAAVPAKPSPAKTEPVAKPSKSGRVLAVALASVAATLVAVLALAALFVNQVERSLTDNLDREDLMPTDTASHPTKEQAAGDALNVVVMGYDSRDPSVQRSGTFRILHLNAERNQAYFITFPRYMWVSIPGHGNRQIGEAYSIGGSKLAVSTLENLTDTQMDHAALADIQGFAKLTNEVGGVTVYNRTGFKSHGFDYPKGNITVSGAQAIYFVGERNLPRGDFDRAANERNLVRAILAKTLSAETMSDPERLFSVVSGAAEHLTVDKGLTNAKIRSTVFSLRLSNKDVHLMKAPVVEKRTKNGTGVVVETPGLYERRSALINDRVDEYLAKYPQA